jgi:hypothetical protein
MSPAFVIVKLLQPGRQSTVASHSAKISVSLHVLLKVDLDSFMNLNKSPVDFSSDFLHHILCQRIRSSICLLVQLDLQKLEIRTKYIFGNAEGYHVSQGRFHK